MERETEQVSMKDTFTSIYKSNGWSGDESISGTGSSLAQTNVIREEIPKLIKQFNISSVLDIPCGDYWWFKEMGLDIKYTGADVVPELIIENRRRYPGVNFIVADITKDYLPRVDLVLCRDLLGHFSNSDVKLALGNLLMSGSKYLLTTTFPNVTSPIDITTGMWRPINMLHFDLPEPLALIDEKLIGTDGKNCGKSLGLWRLGG